MERPPLPQTSEHYPGYPTQRFACDTEPVNGIEIPFGPWDSNTHDLPSPETIQSFQERGLYIDALGRPLHPWADMLLKPENGGMVTGKGAYWFWGPNKTADPIIMTREDRPRILLIERSDTGALALPGGFIDGSEDSHDCAVREAQEETGIALNAVGELLYQGPVADVRTTLHAWAETSAYLFTVDEASPVRGNDDAKSAGWYYVDELNGTLFGSHAWLVQQATERQRTSPTKSVLRAPEAERRTTVLQAGHMAYKHYSMEHRAVSVFVKEHDASVFSDPFREAHSRSYLEKEFALYQHLASQNFQHTPAHVELVDDTLLAMEHLSETDGWHWRTPKEHTNRYIEEVLQALNALQDTQSPPQPEYHNAVNPTHETFWREGWDAIDDDTAIRIADTAAQLAQHWDPTQQTNVQQLIAALPALRTASTNLLRTPELFPAHNDARQSNIAWHAEQGVRIVDWSWADDAPKDADATMFLVDLAKSGYDVAQHLGSFNKEHALTLIGFWLAHSTWKTRDADTSVREHQLAAAVAAHQLLNSAE